MVIAERRFENVVEKAMGRVEEMNPVDRRQRLEMFMFEIVDGQVMLHPLTEGGVQLLPPTIYLSELAVKQLMDRVGYPPKLLGRLPGKLVNLDINWLIQNTESSERTAMIRIIHGDQARAIMGSRYTPLDDAELFSIASEYIGDNATVRYESFGDLATHITVTWPEKVENPTMDSRLAGLYRGIHLANSEVGMRSITVQSILWREVCNNVLPAGLDFGENNGKLYRRGTGGRGNQGDIQSSWRFVHVGNIDRLRDFTRDAIQDSRRQTDVLLARWKQGLTTDVDAISTIEAVSHEGGLTQEQLLRTLDAMIDNAPVFGRTLTGVANAFTLAAQAEHDNEERYKMQGLGSLALRRN
jgi:hypothetical protein